MRKFVFTALYAVCCSLLSVSAQISVGGTPYLMQYAETMNSAIIEMPAIDSSVMLTGDDAQNSSIKAFRVSYNHETNITTRNSGKWSVVANNINVWTVKIQSRGALYLGVVFINFRLKENEKMFVYNNNAILGAYTKDNNSESNILPVSPVAGDILTIEFSSPFSSSQQGTFSLEKVAHFFQPLQEPGYCNIDINCKEGEKWQQEKKSVVKLVIYKQTTGELCSGALINNTAQNGIPYLLTANHCLYSEAEADRTIFYFNYESPYCNGPKGTQSQSLTGSAIKATNYEHDFTLLELDQHPPMGVKPYYAGWSLKNETNLDTVVSIHHPWGGVKKIALYYGHPELYTFYEPSEPAYAENGFLRIPRWSAGVTEKGSSGGPLFDINHRIVGSLTGGKALCGSPINDYYERFSESYQSLTDPTQQLKLWLDPNNTGDSVLDGFNPFNFVFSGCDTLSNIRSSEKASLLQYEYGSGYYSGNNSDSISLFAEKFVNFDSLYLSGAIFNIAKSGTMEGITVQVYEGTTKPEKLVFEKYLRFNSLYPEKKNFIEFYPKVAVKNNYFIAYRIPYNNKDTFCLYQANPRIVDGRNTAYIFKNGSWIAMNNYTSSNWGTALDIQPLICNTTNSIQGPERASNVVTCYPNPVSNKLNIKTNMPSVNIKQILISDITGKQKNLTYSIKNNVIEISTNDLFPGLYLINLYTATGTYKSKFIKVR